MGEVWKARDTRLDRVVALKVLPEEFFENRESVARFEREAKALAAVSHPNIAVVYSFEEISGRYLLVQELLEGETLRGALAKGPLPLRKALDVALQVAEGLAAAHGKGIVHRDVKPENVFLTKDGHAKLLDFGLARHDVTRHDAADTRSPTLAALSEKGAILGTVAYMSPEHARGEAVDFRSDQFSLGVVLYEMLTGKRPFAGTSAAETMAAIIRDEPEPLAKLDPKLPAPVGWIVQRCLSKDPEERYSSTKDLAKELQSLRTHLSEAVSASDVVPGETPRLLRRVPFWTLAAVAALTAVLGLFFGGRYLRTGPPPASPVVVSLTFPLDASPNTDQSSPLALTRDGKTLVFFGGSGDKLFVRQLDREEIRPISGTEGAHQPFISPDGLEVGFFAGGKLKKVALAGGSPVILCDTISNRGGSWGEDGTIVFVPSNVGSLAHPGLGRRAPEGDDPGCRQGREAHLSADPPGRRARPLRSHGSDSDEPCRRRIAPDGRAADSGEGRRVPPVSPDGASRLHSPRIAPRRPFRPEPPRSLRLSRAPPRRSDDEFHGKPASRVHLLLAGDARLRTEPGVSADAGLGGPERSGGTDSTSATGLRASRPLA